MAHTTHGPPRVVRQGARACPRMAGHPYLESPRGMFFNPAFIASAIADAPLSVSPQDGSSMARPRCRLGARPSIACSSRPAAVAAGSTADS
jgi:hypothetical protein